MASIAPLEASRERVALFVLAGIKFVQILDFTILMPLGPILMRDMAMGTGQFGILISIYSLAGGVSGLAAAGFVDRWERKRLMMMLVVLFAVATLTCTLAQDFRMLLVARTLAGAVGGVLGAMVQTVLSDLVPFQRRGKASGTLMSAFSLATIAGVPLSLQLADHFGWRMPFLLTTLLAIGLLALGWKMLPDMRIHLAEMQSEAANPQPPLRAMASVLQDANSRRALLFMALTIFSGYAVIPYIALHATANAGMRQEDVALMYLVGGAASLLTARGIGALADRHGKLRIYRIMALGSLVPLFVQTHLPPVPLWLMLICSTLFFVLVPGRMVPALAIISSSAPARSRGTFLALISALLSLVSGAAAWLGGAMISLDADGRVVGYGTVGWLALAGTLAAAAYVGRLRMHDDGDRDGPRPQK